LYYYDTSSNQEPVGFDVGASFTFNVTTGNSEWAGDFGSYNAACDKYKLAFFRSALKGQNLEYFGIQGGHSRGLPRIGYTRTNYKKVFKSSPCGD
jgi:hypothetical protein